MLLNQASRYLHFMEIRKNIFKQKILKFEKQIGIWSCLSSNTVSEILSIVGFDWIVVDMEHSPNDIQEVLSQLQIIQGFSSEPIVRVPWNEPVMVKRVLEEREERAKSEHFDLEFSNNIYGEHILKNQQGKAYQLSFYDFNKIMGHYFSRQPHCNTFYSLCQQKREFNR